MRNEQLWVDMLTGMRNRSAQIVNDADGNSRNDNWYAKAVYGNQYEELRSYFQKQKMNEFEA